MPIHLVFALVLFHTSCFRASRVLVTLYALKLGAEPLTIGVLAGTFAVFPMLLAWYAGKVTDRYRPRLVMLSAAIISACGLILPFLVPHLAAVFVCASLGGLAATFYNLSMQNLVGRLSTAANRARNYGNYTMAISAANVAGPLIAGISIDSNGHELTFLYVAALLAAPIVLLLVVGRILPANKIEAKSKGGIRDMLFNPGIWPVMAASSMAQIGLELFHVYMPVYGNSLGLSASAIGLIIAVSAVGGFASRFLLSALIAVGSEAKVLAYSLLIGALGLLVIPFCHTLFPLCLIAFVFGCGINCCQPVVMTLMYTRSPEGRAGEALGLRFAVDNAVRAIGPALFGAVASVLGVSAIFWISALLLGAGGMVSHRDAQKSGRGT